MKFTHVITFGNQIITKPIDDEHFNEAYNDIKAQIQAQGGNTSALKVLTDIELEEGEYKIIEEEK